MTRGKKQIVAGLGAVAALGLAAFLLLQDPVRHGDGDGPLGSYGSGYEAMKVDPASGATSWIYGVGICLVSGDAPAILQSVDSTTNVGSGFRLIDVGIREFTPTATHAPIISTNPWPPPTSVVPDPIEDVSGFAVSTPCSGGPNGPYTELLVGLGLVSADGGGWKGIEISYSVSGRDRVLVLDHDLMICGTSVDCSAPGRT